MNIIKNKHYLLILLAVIILLLLICRLPREVDPVITSTPTPTEIIIVPTITPTQVKITVEPSPTPTRLILSPSTTPTHTLTPFPTEIVSKTPTDWTGMVSSTGLWVRSAPKNTDLPIGDLSLDDILTIFECANGWIKISSSDYNSYPWREQTYGWVNGKYITGECR